MPDSVGQARRRRSDDRRQRAHADSRRRAGRPGRPSHTHRDGRMGGGVRRGPGCRLPAGPVGATTPLATGRRVESHHGPLPAGGGVQPRPAPVRTRRTGPRGSSPVDAGGARRARTARSPAESQAGVSSPAVVRDDTKSWVSALEPGQGSHCKSMAQSRVVGVGASPYVALAGVPLFPVDHVGGLAMSRRFGFRPFAVGLAVIVVVGMTAPAVAAPPAAGSKPTPQSIFNKKFNGQISTQEAEGGGDEAEMVRLRGEFQQSITAAPAVVAPAAGLVEARRQAERMPTFGGSWNEVTDKPFLNDPIPRGANYGVGHYIITGRMTAFTSTSDAVYAGSASGGVWRTTDKGVTWQPVNAGLPRLAIGALATDPSDGSVWVGTGEANNAAENQYGVGVYRLARGTDTWRQVGGSELYGAGSYRISWINGYVYIATSHGLYRRPAQAAQTSAWSPVLQPAGPQDYPPSSSVTDVIPVPGSGGRQILAVVGWAGYSDPPATENNGFYVGSGAAGSFAKVTPTGDINPATIGRTTFSSSNSWLYAVVQDTSTGDLRGQGAFVSRSGNPAGPWVRIADVDKLYNSDSALGPSDSSYYPGVQASYNQYILADPGDPKHVYLQLEEVYESTDGSQNWKTVGPYWNYDISCEEANGDPYDCPPTTHPDQHAGMILNGEFWAGNDGGVWRRPVSWHDRGKWTNLNPTLHTTQNYSIDVGTVGPSGPAASPGASPGGAGRNLAYWGGLQDNGESYTRTDLSTVQQAFTGDGGDTIVDPTNGDRAVVEYVYQDMYLTTDASVQTLREISPSCVTATDPPAECDPNPRFIAPIEKDVRNPDHWVSGGQYVWDDTKSWDTVCNGTDGCDWKKVYDTGDSHQISALGVNGNTTYAAWCGLCNPPSFHRGLATNYGGTWHELSLAGIPNRYITSVAVDPLNAAHVAISVGSYSRRWIPDAGTGHVFESNDGGASWRDVSSNLPDAPVYKVLLAGHTLVAGSEVGAFVTPSSNGQAQWFNLGRGLPNVTVWDLVVSLNGSIVAGTHGRGDWELPLVTAGRFQFSG